MAGHRDRVRPAMAGTPRAGGGALLVRPGGYVAWAGGSGLEEALTSWSGPAARGRRRAGTVR
ncbi:hypothetical protein ACIBUQ_20300 [Nonomuraea sp. NPDC049377]|uniref:aromatic-ring hydroxylase C-terminal domain-containing protein n=1 Tax=Nonomuraea sp. NPDC049377 TaxID=3364351 RepID=UPI003795541A